MKMKALNVILSRLLPKTGQGITYAAEDDGATEAGWWKGLGLAFNRTRFVVKTIGGDDVVIDNATGLTWARDGSEAGCYNAGLLSWVNCVSYARGLDFAGFTDWRLPNVLELASIIDYGRWIDPTIYQEFTNTYSSDYFTSTTFGLTTDSAFQVAFNSAVISFTTKSSSRRLRCVRGGI